MILLELIFTSQNERYIKLKGENVDMTEAKKLDARGLFCPEPGFKTNIELAKMQTGETLIVLADDPMVEIDMKDYCSKYGYEVLDMKKTDNDFEFTIKKSR